VLVGVADVKEGMVKETTVMVGDEVIADVVDSDVVAKVVPLWVTVVTTTEEEMGGESIVKI
jgi:hypothetical protein